MISSVQLRDLQGVIECELPNRNLYEFAGTLNLNSVPFPIPLGSDQVLLRGSQLKNTAWIYGLVIYSGHETKLMMVSGRDKSVLALQSSWLLHFRILLLFLSNELTWNK